MARYIHDIINEHGLPVSICKVQLAPLLEHATTRVNYKVGTQLTVTTVAIAGELYLTSEGKRVYESAPIWDVVESIEVSEQASSTRDISKLDEILIELKPGGYL